MRRKRRNCMIVPNRYDVHVRMERSNFLDIFFLPVLRRPGGM